MITYSEADYIVREIGNIVRYRYWVSQYDTELRESRDRSILSTISTQSRFFMESLPSGKFSCIIH